MLPLCIKGAGWNIGFLSCRNIWFLCLYLGSVWIRLKWNLSRPGNSREKYVWIHQNMTFLKLSIHPETPQQVSKWLEWHFPTKLLGLLESTTLTISSYADCYRLRTPRASCLWFAVCYIEWKMLEGMMEGGRGDFGFCKSALLAKLCFTT